MRLMDVIRPCCLAAVSLTSSSLALPSAPASAATAPATAVELRPSDKQGNPLAGEGYYQLVSPPGTTATLYAYVGNRGHRQAGIDLVPVDATSGEYGAISYNLPQQRRNRVGAWVTLSHRWLSLGAGRGTVVSFTVHVPRGTRPGQYIGGLTAFVPVHGTTTRHSFGLTVQTRIVDAIEVTIPGRSAAGFAVTGVKATYRSNDVYVIVRIRNTGTVLLKGYGYIWLYAPGSRKAWVHRAFFIDTTVPASTVHYPLLWAHRIRAGTYSYAVTVRWTGGSYDIKATGRVMGWGAGVTTARGRMRF